MIKKAAYIGIPILTALLGLLLKSLPQDFFPPCIFHAVTGLYCLGCGGTRAVHSLLNGDIIKALGYNAFLVLLLPAALYFYIAGFGRVFFHKSILPVPKNRAPWLWTLLGLAIAFMTLRNVYIFPFALLKP
jgi:hypothetical protein